MDTPHASLCEVPTADGVEALYTPLPAALEALGERRRRGCPTRRDGWLPDGLPRGGRGLAFLSRWFATPNLETLRFLRVARGHGLHPVIEEYHGDTFVGHNPLKHALACLRFQAPRGGRAERLQAVDWAQQGRPMRNLRTPGGRPLAHFHQALLRHALPEAERPSVFECSAQYERLSGCVHAYYRTLLGLCVADGLLFEDFLTEPGELAFTRAVVVPAFRAIEAETGCRPLIVRLCPPGTAEDRRWYSYPAELRPVALSLLGGPGAPDPAPAAAGVR